MTGQARDTLTVGTRGSLLARSQTQWVIERIQRANPGLDVRMQIISTTGDRIKGPLPEVGGKGLFTEELERALIEGTIDLAVHSCKDLPTDLAEGLAILAYPPREDPRDAWISADGKPLEDLPPGSVVGTTSLRRQAQLLMVRRDLSFVGLRGNVDTRIRKVHQGDCAAAVLAMAGLIRAGLAHHVVQPLEPQVMLPAPGQGALALEGRQGDDRVAGLLSAVQEEATRLAVTCERTVLNRLNAGCRAPVAVLAEVQGVQIQATAMVSDPRGEQVVRAQGSRPVQEANALAEQLIAELQTGGAGEIIAACRV
jgi:hydroxymethylbilane synthase